MDSGFLDSLSERLRGSVASVSTRSSTGSGSGRSHSQSTLTTMTGVGTNTSLFDLSGGPGLMSGRTDHSVMSVNSGSDRNENSHRNSIRCENCGALDSVRLDEHMRQTCVECGHLSMEQHTFTQSEFELGGGSSAAPNEGTLDSSQLSQSADQGRRTRESERQRPLAARSGRDLFSFYTIKGLMMVSQMQCRHLHKSVIPQIEFTLLSETVRDCWVRLIRHWRTLGFGDGKGSFALWLVGSSWNRRRNVQNSVHFEQLTQPRRHMLDGLLSGMPLSKRSISARRHPGKPVRRYWMSDRVIKPSMNNRDGMISPDSTGFSWGCGDVCLELTLCVLAVSLSGLRIPLSIDELIDFAVEGKIPFLRAMQECFDAGFVGEFREKSLNIPGMWVLFRDLFNPMKFHMTRKEMRNGTIALIRDLDLGDFFLCGKVTRHSEWATRIRSILYRLNPDNSNEDSDLLITIIAVLDFIREVYEAKNNNEDMNEDDSTLLSSSEKCTEVPKEDGLLGMSLLPEWMVQWPNDEDLGHKGLGLKISQTELCLITWMVLSSVLDLESDFLAGMVKRKHQLDQVKDDQIATLLGECAMDSDMRSLMDDFTKTMESVFKSNEDDDGGGDGGADADGDESVGKKVGSGDPTLLVSELNVRISALFRANSKNTHRSHPTVLDSFLMSRLSEICHLAPYRFQIGLDVMVDSLKRAIGKKKDESSGSSLILPL